MVSYPVGIAALVCMWAGIVLPSLWLLFAACFLGGLSLGFELHYDLAIAWQNWRWRRKRARAR